MLGKRVCPNVSNCSITDLHFPRPTVTLPPPPPSIPQIIGFNPTQNLCDSPVGFNHLVPLDGLPFPSDLPSPPPRSSVFPRSALQTLLAAARQAAELNDSGSDAVVVSRQVTGLLSKPEAFQESTASQASTEAHDTLLTDFDLPFPSVGEKNLRRMLNFDHAAPGSLNQEVNRDGNGKNLSESRHFLYLATSPQTSDVTTCSPTINFLDACYICKRTLGNGLDIFIYRGDTAFCSAECRYQQILKDERKEKLSLSTLRSGADSSSYIHGRNHRSLEMQPPGTAAAA